MNALPLSMFTSSALQRWKVEYIAKAGLSKDARKRAENSSGSILRCARSLFSAKARKYAAQEIILPDPLPFTGVEIPKKGNSSYQSKIDAETIITAAKEKLEGEQFKIFLLAICCGFRKREIDLLTWGQVDFEKGVIRIERTDFSNQSPRIP